MLTRRQLIMASGSAGAVALAIGLLPRFAANAQTVVEDTPIETYEVTHTDAEWHALLSDDQFAVLRRGGTERPYSNALNDEHHEGIFDCAGCDLPLFSSSTKFDSHTGWPSFWQPLDQAVAIRTDTSFGVLRKEVHCRRCGGHLGHVFTDGPKPTGLRYCMNGVAMTFKAIDA